MRPLFGNAIAITMVASLLVLGGCDNGTDPVGPPAAISAVDGDDQQATVGTALPQPIVVRVVDADDRPVPDALVTFVVKSGGGSVALGSVETDDDGMAREFWTLGTSTSAAQQVEARIGGSSALLTATFTATPLAAAPTAIAIVSGNAQSAQVGTAAPSPLVVRVVDQYSNPVPGVTVSFTVQTGGGTMASPPSAVTNAEGIATSGTWTMGSSAASATATASVTGVGSVTFSATAFAAPATRLQIVSQPSAAQLGAFIPALIVELVDAFGNPARQAGVTITIAASANTVSGTFTSVTNSEGRVSFGNLVAGGATGNRTFLFTAQASGIDTLRSAPITFTPGATASVELVSGNNQVDTVGASLVPPVVRARDAWGNVTPGSIVTWQARSANTALTGTVDTTDANGLSSPTSWTVGNPPGTARITAQNTIAISATVLPGNPTSVTSTATHIGVVNTAVESSPGVVVRDRWGNPVSGVTVGFAVASGGGSLASTTATTNSSGIATALWTLGSSTGSQTLQATVGTLAPTVVTATAYNAFTASAVAASDSSTCALDAGAAYCWRMSSPLPAAVPGGLTLTSLAKGQARDHQCGLTAAGAAWCWGSNSSGQLGDGTQTSSTSPVAVTGGQAFTSLAVGEIASCGLTGAGSIYCWGANVRGQLGRGTTTGLELTPAAVSSGETFFGLAAGDDFFCALRTSDSTSFCWGDNSYGQMSVSIANGCQTNCQTTPVRQSFITPRSYATLALGPRSTCGITAVGEVYCWGYARAYSSGTAFGPGVSQVLSSVPVSAMTVGMTSACALSTSSAVYCRAYDNAFGEAGNGTLSPTDFVVVAGDPDVSSIAGSAYGRCGIEVSTNRLLCWGRNPGGFAGPRAVPGPVPKP